jgi:hypothetical protein
MSNSVDRRYYNMGGAGRHYSNLEISTNPEKDMSDIPMTFWVNEESREPSASVTLNREQLQNLLQVIADLLGIPYGSNEPLWIDA